MKCLLVFAVVCVVALAQREPQEGGVERLVEDEVRAIIHANAAITVADCTTKCDAVFGLDVPREEEITDRDCARECRAQIDGRNP